MSAQPSDAAICNLALSHIGASKEIQNLESDKSEEATVCRRFYTFALKEAQRDFPWSFCNVIGFALALVETDPNDEFGYSYRYPSDCEFFKRILSGIRNDTRQSRVHYRIGRDETGKLIYTDKENATCEYTTFEDNPVVYPPDFIMAFSLLLAAYIAPKITAGDPFKLGQRAYNLYLASIGKARANDFNEQQAEEPPDAESVRARQ